ncbi:Pkinase-domain-containing protein [Dendrothele bispora CBS 962.96]|uniref:Pkinase-domain-containing protein n=1 Tax=Dendrothele bispora (strain CBS 962.96) TaxID=1314807 RepID=A0A4S8LFE1_DENBC|nr:Pkinase-domain-containing protein [Dendrothele bispora CBS 962.96]
MSVSSSPPRAPAVKYSTPLGTRWEKERAAAGGAAAFDLPSDPKEIGPWILGECVGKGASGRVKIAKHKRTGQLAAVKILPIAPLFSSRASNADQAKSEKHRLGIDREITMMKLMNHPNILRIYDVYEGSKELFLVLEYVDGGELFDFLVNKGRLSPSKALVFFKQIIYGLNYAHTFSIIHRDLKPENILIASLNPPLLKIADWGMAAFAPPSLQLETSCGSPHYASPEIVNGEKYQGNSTDIWSCGVILYALLTGRLPFDDKNVKVLLNKVKSGKYEMPAWIDPLAKDLITRMLVVDSKRRITIPEILDHPWLRSNTSTAGPDGQLADDTPPLPPSPTVLAQPIANPSLIDPALFASLRIIWGRHSDPEGESIKRDLCSPVGYGTHAKAYYFLLGEYRKSTSRFNESDTESEDTGRTHGMGQRSLTFNLGWELDTSNFGSALATKYGSASRERTLGSSQTSTTAPGAVISGLAPPAMSRNSSSSSRGRPMTPAGPRLPNVPGLPEYPSRLRGPSQPSLTRCDMDRAASSRGTEASGPRPPPPKRGYTISHPGKHESATSTVQFPDVLPRMSYQQTSSRYSRPRSATTDHFDEHHLKTGLRGRPEVKQIQSRSRASEEHGRAHSVRRSTKIPSPICPSLAVLAPVPVRVEFDTSPAAPANADTPLSSLAGPRSADVELQKTTDCFTEQVSESVNEVSVQNHAVERAVKPSRATSVTRERSDKENRNTADISSHRANAEESNSGTGTVVHGGKGAVFADSGNAGVIVSDATAKVKKDKDRKPRPPPLEFSTLNRKHSTLGSPILLSPPTISATAPKANLASPVVGEFKGWLSNLFSRKSSSGAAILYSFEDVHQTRRDVVSFLDSVGVIIDPGESASVNESSLIVQCRVEDFPADGLAHLNMKPVKFRIEVTSAAGAGTSIGGVSVISPTYGLATPTSNSGYFLRARGNTLGGGRSPHASPLPSPLPAASGNGSAGHENYRSVIVLQQEKGSTTTFKAIWRKLRERYDDGSGLSIASLPLAGIVYPSPGSYSPMTATTPTIDHAQRFAV